jgi:hypothetical protein
MVQRFHTHRTTGEDTVASHSWGVAVIVDILCNGKAPADLLRAALYHDIAEFKYGDIPSPAKRLMNSEALRKMEDVYMREHSMFVQLGTVDRCILKIADILDGMRFVCNESLMGNRTLVPIWNTYREYLVSKLSELVTLGEHDTFAAYTTENVGRFIGVLQAKMEQANAISK